MGVLSALVAIGLTAAARQPAPSQPVFRVGAELVVVDLIATDRDGRFVADLAPSDLQLFEDGKPQQVQFLHLVRMGEVAPPAPSTSAVPQAPAGASPGTMSRRESVSSVSLVIAIDLAGTPPDTMPRVKDAIRKMVREELPQNAQVMFVTLFHGVRIHQTFTSDRDAIVSAVDRVPVTAASQGFVYLLDRAEQACDTMGPDKIFEHLSALGRSVIPEMQIDYVATSESISALARSLRPIPGRKHVVLYSMGYAMDAISATVQVVSAAAAGCTGTDEATLASRFAQDFSSLQRPDPAGTIQETIDQANRAQVSVYTIDPRGLSTTAPTAQQAVGARSARRGMLQRIANADVVVPQEYLRAVAANTGGSAFLNTNDLARGLRRAWADASEYYLAGYAPANPGKKKKTFHKIELRVSRPGLTLRYRQGYYELTESDIARRDIETALRFPATFTRAGFDVEASQEGDQLRVIAYVPPQALTFTHEGDERRGTVSVYAVLHKADGQAVGKGTLFAKDFNLRLDEMKHAALLASDNVQISNSVKAPVPGSYSLTLVARDRGGWMAARTIDVLVTR